MLQVAVNTLSVTPAKGGIKTFLLSVLEAMLQEDGRHAYILGCSKGNRCLFEPLQDRYQRVRICELGSGGNAIARILRDQLTVPRWVAAQRPDVLLTPSNIASLRATVPQVVVVQAALTIRRIRQQAGSHGATVSALHRLYYDTFMRPSVRRAAGIVCVSGHLRQNLVAQCPEAADKSVVVHEGVDPEAFSGEREASRAASAEAGPYVLFVSTLFPYKNAAALIRAAGFLAGRGAWPAGVEIHVAGRDPDGRQRPMLQALAAASGIGRNVKLLGPVPHDQLPRMYRRAMAMVYLSSVESFGLPVLEAMAAGTPVIASNRMSVPEVAGDAALIVDPDDTGALAEALRRIITEPGLRQDLVEKGRRRAGLMTWRQTARGVLGALEAAARRSVLKCEHQP